jgi:hypothetical protein
MVLSSWSQLQPITTEIQLRGKQDIVSPKKGPVLLRFVETLSHNQPCNHNTAR